MKTKDDEYVRIQQAAEMLGLSPNTVRKWGALGKIPEFRHPVNAYRLYRRSDLERLIAQVEQSRTQPIRRPATPK
jgi:MerR family copper efflux transcriptional regulator